MHDKRGAIQTNRKTNWKTRHAATAVPTVKKLMMPINKILKVKPRIVWRKYFLEAKQAFRDWITLLKEAAREPTTAKELFMEDPKFLVWVDVSGESVGGGWLPVKRCTGTNNVALVMAKEITGQADNSSKPSGVLGYKRYRKGRKSFGMACVGRNSWHQKPPL